MNEPQMPGNRAPMGQGQPTAPKWLWITLIIVVLIGGAFAAWYYLMGPGKKVATSTTTATTTPAATTTDKTADWQTYTNTTDNYSIKYPKTWGYKLNNNIVEFRETGKTYAADGSDIAAITISTTNNTDSKTLAQIADAQNETGSPVSLKLGGIDALKITNTNVTRVLCIQNNKVYSISANNVGDDAVNKAILIVFNQMIPTFKFTTAATTAAVSTADWKTYTDNKYGFSFKYPTTWTSPVIGTDKSMTSNLTWIETKNVNNDATVAVEVMKNTYDSISDWVTAMNKNEANITYTQKDVTVGGVAGKEITTTAEGGAIRTGVIKGDNLFVIHLIIEETAKTKTADTTTYQTLLSTFQFTQ